MTEVIKFLLGASLIGALAALLLLTLYIVAVIAVTCIKHYRKIMEDDDDKNN